MRCSCEANFWLQGHAVAAVQRLCVLGILSGRNSSNRRHLKTSGDIEAILHHTSYLMWVLHSRTIDKGQRASEDTMRVRPSAVPLHSVVALDIAEHGFPIKGFVGVALVMETWHHFLASWSPVVKLHWNSE